MKTFLRILYQPYKWLIFGPFVVCTTFLCGALAMGCATLAGPRAASIFGVIWARLNSGATPILVKVRGREHIDKTQSYVIVSNHQSQYDIFVLYGWLGIDFKWVMKQELRKVPALGIACEKIGHIFIDRSNTEAALRSLDEAKSKIVNGTSVIFFPEGTRSRSRALGKFKKGAFLMALDLGIPILPVTISGTREILPTQSTSLFPGRATMTIHPPVDISDYTHENVKTLMAKVRNMIASVPR
ncbi:MAG: 1-acyl-sn-glycerol-3-phosphate acyltransferase [Desulfobacterales bacterium]|nr:1-acyl-sn-glycerol-3-phosphate acyltransferase [Desulfobacterales bacterium]